MTALRKLNLGITCYPTYGGSGVIATEIGMAMARRGHRVHFISYDIPRRLDRFLENVFFHEVETFDYALFHYPPYSLSLASKIVEVANYEQLDVIHAHYAVPHATSSYLARQMLAPMPLKIITTLHGTDITLVGKNRSYLPITRFSITQSDGVTTPSQYLRYATYDKLNVASTTPIEVIPNFVDIEIFKPAIEKKAASYHWPIRHCPASERLLVHVSNFRPVKRVDDVVRIFNEVQKVVPSHLALIGDGPERSQIEKLVHDLDLSKRVSFLGKQESFVSVLQNSDVFLLPSESESFGLAALEAMSCGIPVVASDVHGIPEVVIHGETGFLAPVGETEQMAAQVIELLRNAKLYADISQKARARVVENFSLERLADVYEEYYYRIVGSDLEPALTSTMSEKTQRVL